MRQRVHPDPRHHVGVRHQIAFPSSEVGAGYRVEDDFIADQQDDTALGFKLGVTSEALTLLALNRRRSFQGDKRRSGRAPFLIPDGDFVLGRFDGQFQFGHPWRWMLGPLIGALGECPPDLI